MKDVANQEIYGISYGSLVSSMSMIGLVDSNHDIDANRRGVTVGFRSVTSASFNGETIETIWQFFNKQITSSLV